MILLDTSAWVEFLRRTGSPEHLRVRELLRGHEVRATTDVVLMELLAGTRTAAERRDVRRLLGSCEYLRTQAPHHFELAADLRRRCREGGSSVRQLTDCLVAAVAIENEAAVLHRDRDFAEIARHAPLQLA